MSFAPPPGLCADCRNVRKIESAKGSTFWMCELSRTDPRFPKYPPLPVLKCGGYVSQKTATPES